MPEILPTMDPPGAIDKDALVAYLSTAAFFDSLPVYPDDAPDQAQTPDLVVFTDGEPQLRHLGAPMWSVALAVVLTLPRDTAPATVDVYEANLRKVLLDKTDAADPDITIIHPLAARLTAIAAAQSTPIPLHVWDISDDRLARDVEDNGDFAITVQFTAIACTLAS
jgi:hypothetical protein